MKDVFVHRSMNTVSLTDGDDTDGAAFCSEKMREAGVSEASLCSALQAALRPFAGLLKDGHGVGVYVNGEDGSVIGFTAPQE